MHNNLPCKNPFFEIFNLPKTFQINKETLKKKYFEVVKDKNPTHPPELINEAFKTLNDDFSRAKLFQKPSKSINQEFLNECLKMEERIENGEDIKKELVEKIEECKKNYKDPVSLCKWGYYRRLYERL